MSNHRIQAACRARLPISAAALALSVMCSPAVSAATVDPLAAHYFFGTPTGFTVLPPSLPEVAGAGSYTSADNLATAVFTLSPEPSIQLDLKGPTFVGAAFEYAYSITGPGAIPFDSVEGTLTTSMRASGTGTVVAAAEITGTGLTLGHDTAVCYSSLPYCPSTFGTDLTDSTIAVSFASTGFIEIAAAAKVSSFGTASVFIDPEITLPEGYTLTLTSGVGNGVPVVAPPVSAVPEPTTVMSMAVGLALLGMARRRKQNCSASPT